VASRLSEITYDTGSGYGLATFKDGTTHLPLLTTDAITTDFIDITRIVRGAFQVDNTASESFIFTVEGSIDGTNFSTIAYGTGSSAAYTQAASTVAASGKGIYFLPDVDVVRYLRLNVSASNATTGTTVTFFGRLA
jgi:hypothetical protein